MMGGDGRNIDGELTDLHLSAISEAMNQMVGSSATSMASIVNRRIEISAPKAFKMTTGQNDFLDFNNEQKIVKIAFKMEIGDLINSEIMQLLPIEFAKEMVAGLLNVEDDMGISNSMPYLEPMQQDSIPNQSIQQTAASVQYAPPQNYQTQPLAQQPLYSQLPPQGQPEPPYAEPPQRPANHNQAHMTLNNQQAPIDVQPVQYQNFDEGRGSSQKENIGLLMDVPLQITVELGRTQKLIRDILEFAPGSIIELDKLAGEQVDILVNGKIIAKGEVVIIDESFGVRVTDIVQPSKRI
jgi:flagellar motor switch protein FliN/FliY